MVKLHTGWADAQAVLLNLRRYKCWINKLNVHVK